MNGLKLVLFILANWVVLSCEMKKVELPQDLKNELETSKPMVISVAEISGVAHEIGDSIFKQIKNLNDTSFQAGKHKIQIIGKNNKSLTKKSIQEQYDAFCYSFEADKNYKSVGVIDYDRTKEFALYQNAFKTQNEIKLVLIEIDLSEVNLAIAKDRKSKKKKKNE
jgi:hypothetical protein